MNRSELKTGEMYVLDPSPGRRNGRDPLSGSVKVGIILNANAEVPRPNLRQRYYRSTAMVAGGVPMMVAWAMRTTNGLLKNPNKNPAQIWTYEAHRLDDILYTFEDARTLIAQRQAAVQAQRALSNAEQERRASLLEAMETTLAERGVPVRFPAVGSRIFSGSYQRSDALSGKSFTMTLDVLAAILGLDPATGAPREVSRSRIVESDFVEVN